MTGNYNHRVYSGSQYPDPEFAAGSGSNAGSYSWGEAEYRNVEHTECSGTHHVGYGTAAGGRPHKGIENSCGGSEEVLAETKKVSGPEKKTSEPKKFSWGEAGLNARYGVRAGYGGWYHVDEVGSGEDLEVVSNLENVVSRSEKTPDSNEKVSQGHNATLRLRGAGLPERYHKDINDYANLESPTPNSPSPPPAGHRGIYNYGVERDQEEGRGRRSAAPSPPPPASQRVAEHNLQHNRRSRAPSPPPRVVSPRPAFRRGAYHYGRRNQEVEDCNSYGRDEKYPTPPSNGQNNEHDEKDLYAHLNRRGRSPSPSLSEIIRKATIRERENRSCQCGRQNENARDSVFGCGYCGHDIIKNDMSFCTICKYCTRGWCNSCDHVIQACICPPGLYNGGSSSRGPENRIF